MPPIERYGCSECDFELPTGCGGYMYAVNAGGDRQVCPHPMEGAYIREITGLSYAEAINAGKAGYVKHCVCLDCLAQLDLNLERDQMRCNQCGSTNIKVANDLVGDSCPKCHVGTIEKSSPIRWILDDDWESLPVPEIVKDWVAYDTTREVPPSLKAAFDAASKHDDHVFYVVTIRILSWWEGDYFAEFKGRKGGSEPQDYKEMQPQWTWCQALPDVLDSTPELAELIVIKSDCCTYHPALTSEARRGIKNYLRKHREHVIMT